MCHGCRSYILGDDLAVGFMGHGLAFMNLSEGKSVFGFPLCKLVFPIIIVFPNSFLLCTTGAGKPGHVQKVNL
jgi:hypothetical protein